MSMRHATGIGRRKFLERASVTALLGALGGRTPLSAASLEREAQVAGDFDFDEIYDRSGTDSTKWDAARAQFGPQVEVGMGIADMDFRAAPCITRAVAERCTHENWGYLTIPDSFIDSIVAWERTRHGVEIDPATVSLHAGVHSALISGYHAFVPPGSPVLMTTPIYNGFYGSQRFARVVAEESPMVEEGGRYRIDWADFERRIDRCNVFLLCNPQNPTGNCWSAADLMRLGEICLERRVIVFADEIHSDLVPPGAVHTPFASLPNRAVVDNSITFRAVSKTFNLPGLKVSWYHSTNPSLLSRIRAHTRADFGTLAIVATQAGLEEGHTWVDRLLPYLGENHAFTERYIADNVPLVKYRAAEGTYLAWLDVSGLAERIGARRTATEQTSRGPSIVAPEQVVQRWLAENARIAVSPGHSFGIGGANHMRMNIATPRALLGRALENLAEASARA
jgi:cystathionine beta-lyase